MQRKLANALKGAAEALAHSVENFRKPVQLVSISAAWQSLAQMMLVEALGGGGKGSQRSKSFSNDPPPAAESNCYGWQAAVQCHFRHIHAHTLLAAIAFPSCTGRALLVARLDDKIIVRPQGNRQQRD